MVSPGVTSQASDSSWSGPLFFKSELGDMQTDESPWDVPGGCMELDLFESIQAGKQW